MFIQLDDFKSSSRTVAYLFSASCGNIDFSIFEVDMNLPYYYGYIYLIIYLIISNIILINFIIAILTNVYMHWQKYGEGLYLRQILKQYNISSLTNSKIFYIRYVPVFICGVICFLCCSLILTLPAYFIILLANFKNICSCKFNKKHRSKRNCKQMCQK